MASAVRGIGTLRRPERVHTLEWVATELVPALQTAHPDVRIGVSPMLVAGRGVESSADALLGALAPLAPPLRVRSTGGIEYAETHTAAAELVLAALADAPDDVVVQPVAGSERNGRRYPTLTGDLFAENAYPISYLRPADGVARVVFGLGDDLVERADALRFSPRHPDLMPDFSQPEDVLRNGQTRFLALTTTPEGARVTRHPLEDGRTDGTLQAVGGVVSIENQVVYPGVQRKGVPVVTCAMLLRGHPIDLAPLLVDAATHLASAPGEGLVAHRLRFALDLAAAGEAREPSFVIEDLEPTARPPSPPEPPADRVLLATRTALGRDTFAGVRDLVFVPPDRFDVHRSREIAKEIAEANAWHGEHGSRYVLVVAGRLGSTDRSLGVPVRWSDISQAAVQVEVALADFNVEESRGSHFFRQLTQHRVGYLHVSLAQPGAMIHWERLAALPARYEGTFVRHVRLDPAPSIWVDGTASTGWVALGA